MNKITMIQITKKMSSHWYSDEKILTHCDLKKKPSSSFRYPIQIELMGCSTILEENRFRQLFGNYPILTSRPPIGKDQEKEVGWPNGPGESGGPGFEQVLASGRKSHAPIGPSMSWPVFKTIDGHRPSLHPLFQFLYNRIIIQKKN